MNITKTLDNGNLTLSLEGRLDTLTAPDLEATIEKEIANVTSLTLDLEKLEYVSSTGLRVILKAHKIMKNRGEMTVINVCESVMEIFDITNFTSILNIK